MQGLFILVMNILFGVQIRKNIKDFYKCNYQNRMGTKNDDVLDYRRSPNGKYTVK